MKNFEGIYLLCSLKNHQIVSVMADSICLLTQKFDPFRVLDSSLNLIWLRWYGTLGHFLGLGNSGYVFLKHLSGLWLWAWELKRKEGENNRFVCISYGLFLNNACILHIRLDWIFWTDVCSLCFMLRFILKMSHWILDSVMYFI